MKRNLPLYLIACWIITHINITHTYLLPPLFADEDKKPVQPRWGSLKDFFSPKKPAKNETVVLNETPDFGKKHFIIGYGPYVEGDKSDKKPKKATTKTDIIPQCEDGRICSAFFSPDDKIRKKLIALFERERKQIRIAVFHFTDKIIAEALKDAAKRGVEVTVIVDPGCKRDRFNKLNMLAEEKRINVLVYDPQAHKNFFVSLMHHKFILLDSNVYNKSLIITGSFNLTKAAHVRNKENIVILDDRTIKKQFSEQFEQIKKQSNLYTPTNVVQLTLDSQKEQT